MLMDRVTPIISALDGSTPCPRVLRPDGALWFPSLCTSVLFRGLDLNPRATASWRVRSTGPDGDPSLGSEALSLVCQVSCPTPRAGLGVLSPDLSIQDHQRWAANDLAQALGATQGFEATGHTQALAVVWRAGLVADFLIFWQNTVHLDGPLGQLLAKTLSHVLRPWTQAWVPGSLGLVWDQLAFTTLNFPAQPPSAHAALMAYQHAARAPWWPRYLARLAAL